MQQVIGLRLQTKVEGEFISIRMDDASVPSAHSTVVDCFPSKKVLLLSNHRLSDRLVIVAETTDVVDVDGNWWDDSHMYSSTGPTCAC